MSDRQEQYLNFVAGKWKEGSTREWDENRNPARPSEILGKCTRSTTTDVSEAVDAAARAQLDWARKPRPVRAQVLEKVADILRAQADEVARTLTREEGKNLSEAKGEVLKAVNVLEFMASEGRRPVGANIPSEMPNTLIYTTRAPLGVVGIITPWNFPICIPAWKIAPALLEGNAVVFKPASLTPGTAVWLVKAFEQAALPAGLLNLVFGSGSTVGNAIVDHPKVRAISFTGSNEVGNELHARAARRMARTQLEMGGKNPVIVLADADLDQAVAAVTVGAFGSTGQRCTATSRAIVDRKIHAEFREKLLTRVRGIKVGDGLADPSAMGPVVDEKQYKSVLAAIEDGKKEGAALICGGEPVPGAADPKSFGAEARASGGNGAAGGVASGGYFVAPTVFDSVKPEMRLARDEVFGPVLAIIPVDGFDEAIRVANNVEYGLSSSLYTRDMTRVMQYADLIETGILHVNSPTVGGEAQAPFGGMKATGMGRREMGSQGPEFFSEVKTVYIDYNATVRQGNLY